MKLTEYLSIKRTMPNHSFSHVEWPYVIQLLNDVCIDCCNSNQTASNINKNASKILERDGVVAVTQHIMQLTGCNLGTARDFVDQLKSEVDCRKVVGHMPLRLSGQQLRNNVLNLSKEFGKIKAILYYREHTGASISESKQAVESIMGEHRGNSETKPKKEARLRHRTAPSASKTKPKKVRLRHRTAPKKKN